MVEENITFLTSIELPTYCFLSEAVDWLALGRIPQAQWTEERKTYEPVEYRFYWREMPDNFEPPLVFPWFDRLEFEALGIPVNEEYFAAAERCCGEDVLGLPNRISEYEAKEPVIFENDDGTLVDFWKSRVEEDRKLYAELRPLQLLVDRIEAQFRSHYEVAWAKLFQCIARGEIECSGLDLKRWEKNSEGNEYEKAGVFDVLPSTCFSLAVDWKKNKVKVGKKRFVALRVRTSDILKNRSVLLQQGKPATLEQFGSFYMTKGSEKPALRRRRGRPLEANWDDLKRYLSQLIQENAVPASKESCVYALISYAEKKYGKAPSRSSVQRNLTNELSLVFAHK